MYLVAVVDVYLVVFILYVIGAHLKRTTTMLSKIPVGSVLCVLLVCVRRS